MSVELVPDVPFDDMDSEAYDAPGAIARLIEIEKFAGELLRAMDKLLVIDPGLPLIEITMPAVERIQRVANRALTEIRVKYQ